MVLNIDLAPTYHYRVMFGADSEHARASDAASFKTLPDAGQSAAVSVVLTSCLNYAFFQNGDKNHPGQMLRIESWVMPRWIRSAV